MTERIDLAGVVGVADRAIVRQFNAAIGRGMQGIAGMCALMFTEPCFAEYVDHYVGTVADAEYERAVRSDLLSMGYEVDDYGAELVLLPEEERLKRGIERILLPRKLTEEEEEKYNEVLSAVRQVYATAAPTGTPEELATGMVVARQLCLAFNWRAVPTEEDEARAFLHTICKSITGSMEGGTLQWIRAVESVYYADGYATATKAVLAALQGGRFELRGVPRHAALFGDDPHRHARREEGPGRRRVRAHVPTGGGVHRRLSPFPSEPRYARPVRDAGRRFLVGQLHVPLHVSRLCEYGCEVGCSVRARIALHQPHLAEHASL